MSMDEYIKREEATNIAFRSPFFSDALVEEMNAIPAADVAPVRHGRWEMRGGKRYCTSCGERACVTRDSEDFWYTVGTPYCPNCGAKMDEEE